MNRPSRDTRQSQLVKHTRTKHKHTQTQTANLLGVNHYQQISSIERGVQTIPVNLAGVFADYCGLSKADLAKIMSQDYFDLIMQEQEEDLLG